MWYKGKTSNVLPFFHLFDKPNFLGTDHQLSKIISSLSSGSSVGISFRNVHNASKSLANWIHSEVFRSCMAQLCFYSCRVPPTRILFFINTSPGDKLKSPFWPSGVWTLSNESQKQRPYRPGLPPLQCLLLELLSVNSSTWVFWFVLPLLGWIHRDMAH